MGERKKYLILSIIFNSIWILSFVLPFIPFGFEDYWSYIFVFIDILFFFPGIAIFIVFLVKSSRAKREAKKVELLKETNKELYYDERSSKTVLICPSCGAMNDKESKYCKICGNQIGKICPKCGAQLDDDSKFCNRCGSEVE